jgi:hypothetical protein
MSAGHRKHLNDKSSARRLAPLTGNTENPLARPVAVIASPFRQAIVRTPTEHENGVVRTRGEPAPGIDRSALAEFAPRRTARTTARCPLNEQARFFTNFA